ncbi:MAG TPA: heme-copper oxidase subunit III [Actinomycetota bacterium]|nr:heme-copper oxidase subunit III [Actinomycetota bacterium]
MRPAERAHGVPSSLLGMTLFIASELVFFGGLFGAYATLRAQAGTWPPDGTPEIDALRAGAFTVLLLASSATQGRAARASARGDRRALVRWLAATLALGVAFLAGQASEYATLAGEGFGVASNQFGALFFTMTGAHGLHVAIGLVMIAVVLALARGRGPAPGHGAVEAVSYYWHFVDVVWIGLFSVLYLAR